jgi:polar amino acid transport system substrate-binding protein
MKKLIALMLAALMAFGIFAGCTPAEEGEAGTNKFNLTTIEEGYLTVVTSPDYAPYEFYALDENGTPTLAGFDMDLAQYIADYLGLTLKVTPIDFNGIIGEMGAGTADLALAGLSPEPERLEKMDFSSIYYGGKQAFVTTSDKQNQFTDLASTNKAEYSIGAQSGTIQEGILKELGYLDNAIALTNAQNVVMELMEGKVDVAYMDYMPSIAFASVHEELTTKDIGIPLDSDGQAIAVQKGDAEFVAYLDGIVAEVLENGKMDEFIAEAQLLAGVE